MFHGLLELLARLAPAFVAGTSVIILVTAIHLSRTASDLLEMHRSMRSLPRTPIPGRRDTEAVSRALRNNPSLR